MSIGGKWTNMESSDTTNGQVNAKNYSRYNYQMDREQ
jgi:hypothetical protein